jgi:hypothetical protein
MEILAVFKHALMITFFVFVMMLLVDFIDTANKRRMSEIMNGGQWRQYTLCSFLVSTPGCLIELSIFWGLSLVSLVLKLIVTTVGLVWIARRIWVTFFVPRISLAISDLFPLPCSFYLLLLFWS